MGTQTDYNKKGILLEAIIKDSANSKEKVRNSIKGVFNAIKGRYRGSDESKNSKFINLLSNLLRYENVKSSGMKGLVYEGIKKELVDEIYKNRTVKKYWINQIFLIKYGEFRNFFDGGLEKIFDCDYSERRDIRLNRQRDVPLKAHPYKVRQDAIIFRELSHLVNKGKRFMDLGKKELREANKQFRGKIEESKEFIEKTDFLIMSYFNLVEDYNKFSENINLSNYRKYFDSIKKLSKEVDIYLKNAKDDQIKFLREYFGRICDYYRLRMSYDLVSNEPEKLKLKGSRTISTLLGEASVLSLVENPHNANKKDEKYFLFERVKSVLPKMPQYLIEYHADPGKIFREKGLTKK